ncbi:MAG: D-alanyl-D-alanine dipeptidase [Proteobacteria bacterium]|nr:D-alanyl-D-alanine dipeptidase [Pseudomonadota bacterium]
MKKIGILSAFIISFSCQAYDNYLYIADDVITSIPVKCINEEMIDLNKQTEIAYGKPPLYPNNKEYTKIRKTVYEKLKQAQSKLPPGLKLCVYEGYRKLGVQEYLFRTHFQQIQEKQPLAPYEITFTQATRLIAPARKLDGSENIAPQLTGGAIAVYLVDDQGKPVDMGIQPQDWLKDMDGSLSRTHSYKISKAAEHHREIMSDALRAVGFVNYPAQYWHWSYGDQYWAHVTHQDHAIYGTWQQSGALASN